MEPNVNMDKVAQLIQKSRDEWAEEYLKDVPKYVDKLLSDQFDDIIKKFLGMEKRWGGWEVDHCNGRAGNSIIGEEIKAQVHEHLKGVITAAVKNVKLSPAQVNAVQAEYRERLVYALRDAAMRKAEEDAEVIFGQLVSGEYVPEEPPAPTAKKSHPIFEGADD